MNNDIDLGGGNVGKLLFKLAVPTITAQLINALYNIVDRMYIGHMAENGTLALAGLTVSFPIVMLISAFASLMAQGGAPIASIYMGKGEDKKAENLMGNCFSLLIITALVLTVFFQIFKRPILFKVGASENTIYYAEKYLSIYLLGTLPVLISLGLNMFINTQGFSQVSMKTVLIGAVLNIILDPIFIYGFNMGVSGAAIATILSQTVSAIWVLFFLTGKKTKLKLKFKHMVLKFELVKASLSLGVSPFAMMSTESIIGVVLNATLFKYGGDMAVTAMGILSSLMMFVFMPLQGLAQGAQPIISFNYGASKFDRVKSTFYLLLKSAVIMAAILWIIIMLFPQVLASFFTSDSEVILFAVPAMRIYFFMVIAMGIQMSCQQSFLATGQAKVSLFLALLRKMILLMPLALIFAHIWGTNGVFIAEPVADFIAATVTFILFMARRHIIFNDKKDLKKEGEL